MSAPEGTRASVTIADYISLDAGGKMNAIGFGVNVTSLVASGLTAPQFVAVTIALPASSAGSQITMSLELRDTTTDTVVMAATPPTGQMQALRVQQLLDVQRPSVPGIHLPHDIECTLQTLLGFPTGLPLTPGHRYSWRLEIDGTRRKGWEAPFYVLQPPRGPIIGGPAGPSDIPNVQNPVVEEDE